MLCFPGPSLVCYGFDVLFGWIVLSINQDIPGQLIVFDFCFVIINKHYLAADLDGKNIVNVWIDIIQALVRLLLDCRSESVCGACSRTMLIWSYNVWCLSLNLSLLFSQITREADNHLWKLLEYTDSTWPQLSGKLIIFVLGRLVWDRISWLSYSEHNSSNFIRVRKKMRLSGYLWPRKARLHGKLSFSLQFVFFSSL